MNPYTQNQQVFSGNLQMIQEDVITEGSQIPATIKEIGTTDTFVTSLIHLPNGCFVTVLHGKIHLGIVFHFTWGPDSNTYTVLESHVKLKHIQTSESMKVL